MIMSYIFLIYWYLPEGEYAIKKWILCSEWVPSEWESKQLIETQL